jgi:hypothetical protein
MIFMVWGVGGRGAAGFRIKGTALEVAGRGASGSIIITKAWDGQHFHGFGSGWEVGGWPPNHEKCMRLLSFSKFSKCLGHME